METYIVILLGLIAVWVWSINLKLNNLGERQESLDYPFYSLQSIKVAKIEWEYWEKQDKELNAKVDQYFEEHKEELDKIKKHKDYPQECKDLIYKYHNAIEEVSAKRKELNFMLEANYAIKSGRKTFDQMGKEVNEKYIKMLKKEKSMYEGWLEYEKK